MKKIIALVLIGFLAACTGNIGADKYETSSVGKINTAAEGVIINVRTVRVATSDGVVGKVAGGVAGGIAGSTIGGGTGSALATVGGVVLGGILGDKAQESLSAQDAYEYIVKLNNGNTITLTQGTDVELKVGQKVYVLDANSGHRARIIPR